MQFMIILQKVFVLEANCKWYGHSKKSTKFFLNLEKQIGAQNTIKNLIADDKEIIDQIYILEYIKYFMKLFLKNANKKLRQKLKIF